MTILRVILGALIAKWGSELVAFTLRELGAAAPNPEQLHLANRIEQLAAARPIAPTDAAQLDLTAFDFEDTGYIWDSPSPCYED